MKISNRHTSRQDYPTPQKLIQIIEQEWGQLTLDLAATAENRKAPYYLGPEHDSLKEPWHLWPGTCWLNPPFKKIGPWARKCREEAGNGARIIMLVPNSTGARWFRTDIHGHARVILLAPRITFEGMTNTFTRDLVLCLFGLEPPGYETWYLRQPRVIKPLASRWEQHVIAALKTHRNRSDRFVARLCGVSDWFVRKIRKSTASYSHFRAGLDGRTRKMPGT